MRHGKIQSQSDIEAANSLKVYGESVKPDVLDTNIVLNAFRIAVNGSLTQFNMVDGIVDEYEDETGIAVSEFTPFTQYKCNETTGTTVTDTGTGLNNGTSSVDISNLTVAGKINNAFEFNGSSENITMDNLASAIRSDITGSFTCWVYHGGTTQYPLNIGDSSDDNICGLQINSNKPRFVSGESTGDGSHAWELEVNNAITPNTWFHVAIVQDGVEPIIYINGVAVPQTFITSVNKTLWFAGTEAVAWDYFTLGGYRSFGSTFYWGGRLDDVRYYSNKALTADEIAFIYNSGTGTETLTLGECINISYNSTDDYYSPYSLSLASPYTHWKFNELTAGAITDYGTGGYIYGAGVSNYLLLGEGKLGAEKKFGVGSAGFDGSHSYLSIPDHDDWYFGTGDFTIDFWVKFNSSVITQQNFVGQWVDANNYWRCELNADKLNFVFLSGGTTYGGYITTNTVGLTTGTWYHIAFVRNGSNAYIFVNGVSQTLTTIASFSTNDVGNIASLLEIGAINTGNNFINGYIDELRISKGIARWTTGFTPPTSAYTSDTNTKLLLHLDGNVTDSGNTTHTVTNNYVGLGGFDFAGTTNYYLAFQAGLTTAMKDDTTGSISIWTKADTLDASLDVIFSLGDTDGDSFATLYRYEDDMYFQIQNGSSSNRAYWIVTAQVTTSWQHWVISQNGTALKIYLNGSDVTPTPTTVGTGTAGIWFNYATALDNGTIGARNYNSAGEGEFFDGKLDDFRYYTGKSLTADEVALLYNSGVGTEETTIQGTTENMTLISENFTAEAQPDTTRIVLFEEDVDTITLNTDLLAYVSRDGGTTYSQITIVNVGQYESGKNVLAASVDISGQPAGTSLKYKIVTANNKDLKLHGTGLTWD